MATQKGLKKIGIAVAILAALCVAAVVAVRIAFPPEKLRALIVPRAEAYLGRTVAIDNVGVSLFPFVGVRVRGLMISESEREIFTDSAFLSVGDFQLRVAVMPLLRREVHVERIVMKDLYVRVEADTAGVYNYSDLAFLEPSPQGRTGKKEAPEKGMPMLPIPLSLQRLEIRDGALEYINHKDKHAIVLGNISQHAQFSMDAELRDVHTAGELRIDDIAVKSGDLAKPLQNLSITLEHVLTANVVEQKATIEKIRASVQDVYLTCGGTVDNFLATPTVSLSITTDTLDVQKVLAAIPGSLVSSLEGATGSGKLFLRATVDGQIDSIRKPRVRGVFRLADVSVEYPDFPESLSDCNAEIAFTEDSLRVERFAMNIGENPVRMTALVADFDRPWIDATVDATVDLATVSKMAALPESTALSGIVAAQINATGRADPSDPSRLTLDGGISLRKVAATTPAITKPVVTSGEVKLSSSSVRPDLTMTIGSSSLSLDGALTNYLSLVLPDSTQKNARPHLQFTLHAPLLNADEFLPEAEKDVGGQSQEQSAEPALLLPAPLPGIDLKGVITTDRLLYQGIVLTNIDADLHSVDDVMDFAVNADMYKGEMNHVLRVDARNIQDLRVNSEMTVDGVEINAFLSAVNDLLPANNALYGQLRTFDDGLYGTARMNTEFRARGSTMDQMTRTLEGTLLARVTDGKITGGPIVESINGSMSQMLELAGVSEIDDIDFRDMRIRARVKNQRVHLDTVVVASAATGDWNAHGAVGFDASLDVDVANRLPKSVSSKMNNLAGGVQKTAKDLIGQLGLGGAASQYLSDQADNLAFPTDRAGRITVLLTLRGTVTQPVPSGFRVAPGTGASSEAQKKPSQRARDELLQKKKSLEEKAAQRLDEEKKRAEQEAKKREERARKELEQKKKEAEKAIEEKADEVKKKLKGLF